MNGIPFVDWLRQLYSAVRSLVGAVFGNVWYVDGTGLATGSGSNGNNGHDWGHAFATLTYALTVAKAGDTIMLREGGSETVTATIAANLAGVRIICETDNPTRGYTITGAGTLDLMTVSAAGVFVKGLVFVHTGATASGSGILTTAGADGLVVENCIVDDSAIATTFTGAGVELTDDTNDAIVQNCIFKDCQFGIKMVVATGAALARPTFRNNRHYTGKSAAFGIASAITGAGTIRGMRIDGELFYEAIGTGAPATVAWDGTDGANATQGPVKLEAGVDQYIITNCVAHTALASIWNNIQAINAGAVGTQINNYTSTGPNSATNDNIATADGTANALVRDAVGNKTDAVVTAIGTTKSLMAYLKTALSDIGFLADVSTSLVGTATSVMSYIKGIIAIIKAASLNTTGQTFYVDSSKADDTGSGLAPATAKKTLAAAITLCTDNAGDRIIVAPGFSENVASAGALVFNKIGVKIIGLGEGTNRPLLQFTSAASATVTVTAANVTLQNFRVKTTVDELVTCFAVTAAHFTLDGVDLVDNGATAQMLGFMTLSSAATDCTIRNCKHLQTTAAAGETSWIEFDAAHRLSIEDCRFEIVTINTANSHIINGTTAATLNAFFKNVYIYQTAGANAIPLTTFAGSTGIQDNVHICAPSATAIAGLNALTNMSARGCTASNTAGKNGAVEPAVDT